MLIATAGLYMGTSACSGSDKQTLFTAATAGNGDNFTKLAEALASGGAMDHDTAYVEAVGSLHTLGGLQYLGLELPEDRYGAILRYQTDHDEAGRATSCGPRTSRLMVKVLLEEVQRLAIPVLTSATVIKLLHQRDENGEDRVAGQSSRPVIAPITHGAGNCDCAQCGTGNRRAWRALSRQCLST